MGTYWRETKIKEGGDSNYRLLDIQQQTCWAPSGFSRYSPYLVSSPSMSATLNAYIDWLQSTVSLPLYRIPWIVPSSPLPPTAQQTMRSPCTVSANEPSIYRIPIHYRNSHLPYLLSGLIIDDGDANAEQFQLAHHRDLTIDSHSSIHRILPYLISLPTSTGLRCLTYIRFEEKCTLTTIEEGDEIDESDEMKRSIKSFLDPLATVSLPHPVSLPYLALALSGLTWSKRVWSSLSSPWNDIVYSTHSDQLSFLLHFTNLCSTHETSNFPPKFKT